MKKLFLFLTLLLILIVPTVSAGFADDYLFWHWSMDQTGSSNLIDSMGRANLSRSNSVGEQTGILGNARGNFQDAPSLGRYSSTEVLDDPMDEFTINFWSNATQAGGGQYIFHHIYNGEGIYCSLISSGGKKINCAVVKSSTTYSISTLINEEIYEMVTFMGNSSGYSLWINGSWRNETSANNGYTGSDSTFSIGSDGSTTGSNIKGYIDHFSIYNNSMESWQLLALYNESNGCNEPFDCINGNLTIYLENEWDGTTINTFNATIDGYTYNTTQGFIRTNISQDDTTEYDITIESSGYISKIYEDIDASENEELFATLYQTITNFTLREYPGESYVSPFSIESPAGVQYNSTGNIVTAYPNLGSVNVEATASGYHTFTSSITLNNTYDTVNIYNAHDTKIVFIDNITSSNIAPECGFDGYSLGSLTTQNITVNGASNTSIVCGLFGYNNVSIDLSGSYPQNISIDMLPAHLWLIFDENVSGYIATSDNATQFFNDTQVYIRQDTLPEGYVNVIFNEVGGNYLQKFTYYNNFDTHIKQYIHIEEPDIVQEVRAISDGEQLEEARICVYQIATHPETAGEEWLLIYCDYTDEEGDATVQLNDENLYKFCGQKTGYISSCIEEYIDPLGNDPILIELEKNEGGTGINYFSSTCSGLLTTDKTCNVTVITYKPYYSICIDYNFTGINGSTCVSDSITKTISLNLNESILPGNVSIFLDGELAKTYYYNWFTRNTSVNIDITEIINSSGSNLLEIIASDAKYSLFAYCMFFLIGIILGILAGNRWGSRYGIIGSSLIWFVVGSFGFYWLYLLGGLTGVFFLYRTYIELWKGN